MGYISGLLSVISDHWRPRPGRHIGFPLSYHVVIENRVDLNQRNAKNYGHWMENV